MSKHLANSLVRIGGLILLLQALLTIGSGFFLVIKSHLSSRSIGMELGDIAWLLFPTLVPLFAGFILLRTSGFFASIITQENVRPADNPGSSS